MNGMKNILGNKRFSVAHFRIIPFILIVLLSISCVDKKKNEKQNEKLETLTVGIQVSPAMGLVMVAEEEGFFDQNGVNVEIVEFTAGKFALQSFLGGSIDIAISGDVPVTLSSLQGNEFKVIGQVVEKTINETRIVAKKIEGIDNPKDYFNSKKIKLATSFGGGPEFFTYNFLKLHNIQDVELISQKPEDMPAALSSGSIDAISIFDPFARVAELQMGDQAITFKAPEIYSELYVIDVMEKTINTKRELLKNFLKGLKEANQFMKKNPEKSKEIVIKYTKLDQQIIDDIWDNFVFDIVINDLFLEYSSAEAIWAIESGKFPANTPIPDFNAVLYPELLFEVDSTRVRLSTNK